MELYRLKIKNLADLKAERAGFRSQGKKVVFTNGCFDILHPGHLRYLYAARQLGDYLVIGLNSDQSVQTIKGPERPILGQAERAEMLAALEFVDRIVIFAEPDPFNVISELVPDVLVKGADWAEDAIIGADVVKKAGGRVKTIPFVDGFSTTQIIQRVRQGEKAKN
ncbi:MAG: D-glycero-beta-D-manno-heptose 1-phosphate adenylyltransferase [Desulfobacteraceae bacterium]|nr:MAG: D-glycero-beta-D-manno-heptose 1-phosphate adenylyltransferase [Desulfobacteraceae bacterium]